MSPKDPTTYVICRDALAVTIAITSPQSKYVIICCPALTTHLISNYLLPIEPVNLNREIGGVGAARLFICGMK